MGTFLEVGGASGEYVRISSSYLFGHDAWVWVPYVYQDTFVNRRMALSSLMDFCLRFPGQARLMGDDFTMVGRAVLLWRRRGLI
jgi:hypothetical protein